MYTPTNNSDFDYSSKEYKTIEIIECLVMATIRIEFDMNHTSKGEHKVITDWEIVEVEVYHDKTGRITNMNPANLPRQYQKMAENAIQEA